MEILPFDLFITDKKLEISIFKVEPAVEEAQMAVKGIRKAQLVEVRSMSSPPNLVKLALESVCLLLGEVGFGHFLGISYF